MGRLRAMCAQSVPPQSCLSGGGGDACRAAPRCSVLGTAACEGANWRGVCRGLGAARPQPQLGCTHPACARVAEASAAESGQFSLNCVWSPRLKAVSGRSDAYCAHSLLPWAARGELNASVMDFTPNYICDADAMARIHDSAAERPEAVKFIVVVRDPVARAFSEWSMFALGSLRYRERGQDTARAFASQPSRRPLSAGWNWDPVKNFSAAMAYKLQALQRCNRSLYLNVSRWLCSGRLGRSGHLRGKPRVNLPPIDFEQAAPAAHHGARRAFAAASTRLLEMTPEIKIDCSRRAGARRVPAEVLRLRPRDNVRACGPPHLSCDESDRSPHLS